MEWSIPLHETITFLQNNSAIKMRLDVNTQVSITLFRVGDLGGGRVAEGGAAVDSMQPSSTMS